jgi:hypothetical protein
MSFLRNALLFFFLVALAPSAKADCCNAGTRDDDGGSHTGLCADFTKPTPCCGVGACNAFCCNCDGGCRKSTPPPPCPTEKMEECRKKADTCFNIESTECYGEESSLPGPAVTQCLFRVKSKCDEAVRFCCTND